MTDDSHDGADIGGLPPSTHNLDDPLRRLREDLAEANSDLSRRVDELLAGVERAPVTVADEATAMKLADFVKQIKAAVSIASSRRVEAKRPFLDSGRVVDAFFDTRLIANLDAGAKMLLGRLSIYQRAKADAARKAAEAAERARREEEQKARAEMEAQLAAARNDADLQRAIAAEAAANLARAQAAAAAAIAAGKPAELSRSRGDLGAVASLRRTWRYDLLDIAAVPREYLYLDPSRVNAAIKAGVRDVPGLRIFEHTETVVR